MPADQLIVSALRDQAIRDHLEEGSARTNWRAVVVTPIDWAKLPATTAIVEILKEAVPGAAPCVCFYGIAAVLSE
ncbi:MAG: hypothetical protein ABSB35_10295 [Bryobacteraceae bacterium]|jgi:hypothetical protein